MKLVQLICPLLCVACLWSSCVQVSAGKQQKLQADQNTIQAEESDEDPRPKTKNFGLPRVSDDGPVGSHDFSHSDPTFKANRDVLEFTQLASGTGKGHDPQIDNPLATLQRVLEDGESLVETALNDQLGISVPTKLVEGGSEDYGLQIIKMATAMLKDLIATPRHQSRLPLGISSTSRSTSTSREKGRQAESRAINSGSGLEAAQVQRTLLEMVEQLVKLGLDESNLQDPAFEQLIDRIRMLILGFRARPTLRT